MVVGNSQTLSKSEVWGNMVEYCKNPDTPAALIPITDRSQYSSAEALASHIQQSKKRKGGALEEIDSFKR